MNEEDKELSGKMFGNVSKVLQYGPPDGDALLMDSATTATAVQNQIRDQVRGEIRAYLVNRGYDHVASAPGYSPLVAGEKVHSMDLVRLKKHLEERFKLPRRSLDLSSEVEEHETIDSITEKVLSSM